MEKHAHQVESGAGLEPFNLTLVEGVCERDLGGGTICVSEFGGQVLSRGKALQSEDGNLVSGLNLVVVGGVGKSQGKHTLLLQVGLVDTGERFDDDSKATEETGLESGVFTGRTFTVVVVADNDPLDALLAVCSSSLGNTSVFTSELVLDLVDLAVLSVNSTNQAILRNVLEMPTVLEPRSTGGDVISGWREP